MIIEDPTIRHMGYPLPQFYFLESPVTYAMVVRSYCAVQRYELAQLFIPTMFTTNHIIHLEGWYYWNKKKYMTWIIRGEFFWMTAISFLIWKREKSEEYGVNVINTNCINLIDGDLVVNDHCLFSTYLAGHYPEVILWMMKCAKK